MSQESPEPPLRRPFQEYASIAALGVLALVLRLVYVFQVKDTVLVVPEELDPAFYYEWARAIAAGDWLGKGAFVQSPLYAYLLGAVMKVIGADVGRILVVQAFAGCATVLLTYWAGRRLLGHANGLVAGVLVAFYGPFLFYEGQIMKTFLSPLLTILLVIVFDVARVRTGRLGRPALRWFALAGAVYGLTTLDRDNFIILAPVLALLALWLAGGMRRGGIKPGLAAAGAFTLGTVLLIAPATLHNWAASRELVLLTTGGGEVFFIGNNADANGLYVPPPFVRPDPKFEHADFIDRASEVAGRKLTPMESSWFWFREGVKFIADEPLSWLRLLGLKMAHFWNYHELPDNLDYEILQEFSPLLAGLNATFPPPGWPTLALPRGGRWVPVRIHLFSAFGTLAPLGLLGIVLARRRWRILLPSWVLLFGYTATVMLFFNFSRFRVPVVPILALFAALSLAWIGAGLARAGRWAVALASRSGDLPARTRALLPGRRTVALAAVLVAALAGVNAIYPRGVIVGIEQALNRGNAYYGQSRFDDALHAYLDGLLLLAEGPDDGRAERLLVRRYGPEATREAIRREVEAESIVRGPQFKGIHLGIHHGIGIALVQQADALIARGDRRAAMPLLDTAITQFEEALRLAPSYLLSIRKLARACTLKGDAAAAEEWLAKGVDLWPEDFQARLDLSEVLFNRGEYKGSLRHLDEARQYNKTLEPKDSARLDYYRGLVFYRGLDQPGRALTLFESALEQDPAQPQAGLIKNAIFDLRARGFQPLADVDPPPAEAKAR